MKEQSKKHWPACGRFRFEGSSLSTSRALNSSLLSFFHVDPLVPGDCFRTPLSSQTRKTYHNCERENKRENQVKLNNKLN